MLENFETLEALDKYETMSSAGTAMRISQSAVSKRIAALEQYLNRKLITRDGRRVVLTESGKKLLEKIRPLLQELRHIASGDSEEEESQLRIILGISESILSSWGSAALKTTKKKYSTLEIIPHTHRSPVVIDRVRSGDYQFGICAGRCEKAPDLELVELGWEPFVIIRQKNYHGSDLMTIEEKSETWASIAKSCLDHGLDPTMRLESFAAATQLAMTGMLAALVPRGVANAFKVPKSILQPVGVKRPVVLVAGKSTLKRQDLRPIMEYFIMNLKEQLKELNNQD